jgi:hypothetical protein
MYLIILADSASSKEFSLPEGYRTAYSTYEGALAALKGAMGEFEATPILYGEVFPYERITFKDHLDQKGYAFYGYGTREVDGDDYSMVIGLVQIGVV